MIQIETYVQNNIFNDKINSVYKRDIHKKVLIQLKM